MPLKRRVFKFHFQIPFLFQNASDELLAFYLSHSCAVMFVDAERFFGYLVVVVAVVSLFLLTITGLLVALALRIAQTKVISTRTYKMHKSLTISLCIQVIFEQKLPFFGPK